MALEHLRFKGVARKGKIELEPGANLPDGAEVVVLFETGAPQAKLTARELAKSEFVGDWAGRKDLPASPEEFAEWRRKLWERPRG